MNQNTATLPARLEKAREKLTYLRTRQERLNARSEAVTPGKLADGTWDSAVLSGTMRKPNHKQAAARYNTYSLAASGQLELDQQERLVAELEQRVAAAEAEANRVPFTRDDLAGVTHVRTRYGWHKVARLNPTTVSVETGYSWTDRHPYDKILEVRSVPTSPDACLREDTK